jgi:hypothetical protein
MESRKYKIALYTITVLIMILASYIIVSQLGWPVFAGIFLFTWANNIYLKHYDG